MKCSLSRSSFSNKINKSTAQESECPTECTLDHCILGGIMNRKRFGGQIKIILSFEKLNTFSETWRKGLGDNSMHCVSKPQSQKILEKDSVGALLSNAVLCE